MKKNGFVLGFWCVIIMFVLIIMAALSKEKESGCALEGCNIEKTTNNSYCYLHKYNHEWYTHDSGNTNYSEKRDTISGSTDDSTDNSTSSSMDGSTGGTSGGTLGGNSGSSSGYKGYSSGSYNYSSNDSYDDGYDDIYFDEDYDWERYRNDEDYARGVDDAMEDEDW